MTHLTSFARAAWCTTFVLALASACGGQSFKGGETGEAGTGGTMQTAGSSNRAGSKATGGGSSGGSGTTAGTGSTIDVEACTGPSENSTDGTGCDAYFPIWRHNEATGICEPDVYGGCGASKNNYPTLEACQKACPGGNPNYDACQVATDCALGATGCCGVCDGPEVTAHDFIAYNKNYASKTQQCAGDVACGACPPVVPIQNTRQFFIADCVRGECVVEDIRESAVSACTTADDCQLRNGSGCCEGCSTDGVVAVRNDGSLEKLVCGEFLPPCDPCEAPPAAGAVPLCNQGHCSVGYLLDDTAP